MSSVDRRAFLKGIAAATAGSVVAPALHADAVTEMRNGPVWKKAPCTLCSMGCGLLVGIQNGRAVAVKGDPDSPVSRGLACVKGYHAVQTLYARDRITRAQIRRNGVLVDVPLQEAFDLVARRLQETAARSGKDSVAWLGSASASVPDLYLANKLFRNTIGTGSVDTDARLHSGSASAGLLSSFGLDGAVGCYEDIEHADVFVLWNENLAETHPVLFSRILARRRTNPAVRIIDLTTRTTRTSYGVDRSILFKPLNDVALANAIAHELVTRKLLNRDFIDKHVAFKKGSTAIGHDLTDDGLLADDVRNASLTEYSDFLSTYSADRAPAITGVSTEDVRWLATLYGDRSRRVMTIWADSANQQARGTWLNNTLYNLHLLTGKIATPGNAALCVSGHANHAGTSSATGRSTVSMFRALERGAVRFLWIQSADPMLSLPHLSRYRSAARKEDRFIVVSAAYPNPTTDIADVVLPSALWIEQEGVHANAERRAQRYEQMLQPPGDATADGWQLIEVARRLGHTQLFNGARERHATAAWEEYRRTSGDARTRLPAAAALRAAPGVLWPVVDGQEAKWRYHAAHDPLVDRAHGTFDFYGHADHRAWIWLRPLEAAPETPDRSFPYWLTTGVVLEHSGTGALTQRVPTLHRAMPHAYAELNGADAAALGIRSGDRVRISSRRGALDIEARIDQRSQPPRGHIFVATFDEAHPVNLLTLDACCPLSGQPASHACAARVVRISAEAE